MPAEAVAEAAGADGAPSPRTGGTPWLRGWEGGSCPLFSLCLTPSWAAHSWGSTANRQPASLFHPRLLRFFTFELRVYKGNCFWSCCVSPRTVMLLNPSVAQQQGKGLSPSVSGAAGLCLSSSASRKGAAPHGNEEQSTAAPPSWAEPKFGGGMTELFSCTGASALQVLCLQAHGSRSAKEFCNS